MPEWGQVRTTGGSVLVHDDAIEIRRTLRGWLTGRRASLSHASGWERAKRVGGGLLFMLGVVSLAWRLASLPELAPAMAVFVTLGVAAFALGPFWYRNLRTTRVPLSATESADIEPDERTLTITHERTEAEGLHAMVWSSSPDSMPGASQESTETTVTLRSADDVREARTVLRTRDLLDADEAVRRATASDRDERRDRDQDRDRGGDAERDRDGDTDRAFDAERGLT